MSGLIALSLAMVPEGLLPSELFLVARVLLGDLNMIMLCALVGTVLFLEHG